jgi:hypothetical protein
VSCRFPASYGLYAGAQNDSSCRAAHSAPGRDLSCRRTRKKTNSWMGGTKSVTSSGVMPTRHRGTAAKKAAFGCVRQRDCCSRAGNPSTGTGRLQVPVACDTIATKWIARARNRFACECCEKVSNVPPRSVLNVIPDSHALNLAAAVSRRHAAS